MKSSAFTFQKSTRWQGWDS